MAEDLCRVYKEVCAEQDTKPSLALIDALVRPKRDREFAKRKIIAQPTEQTTAEGKYDEDEEQKEQEDSDDEEHNYIYTLSLQGNSLELFNSRLVGHDIGRLVTALERSGAYLTLARLDLGYNNIGNAGVHAITELLSLDGCVLQELELRQNSIDEEGACSLAKAIENQKENASIVELDLEGNAIGCKGGMALASMLKDNRSLKKLNIGSTEQDMTSLIAMATVLRHNDCLSALVVDNPRLTSINEEATDHFARMLNTNQTLLSLSMSKWDIRDEGARLLAEYGIYNRTLQRLNLRCNRIGVGGARALALWLANGAPSLVSLNLEANRVCSNGAVALGEALQYNNVLQQLNLANNAIGDEGLSALADGLAGNATMRKCFLWDNLFEEDSPRKLMELLHDDAAVSNGHGQVVELDVLPYVAAYDQERVQIARESTAVWQD